MDRNYVNITFAPGRVELRNYAKEQEAYERAEEERQRRESERQAMEKTMQSAVLADFYEYQPIRQSWTTRLLILNSANSGDKLTGRLEILPVAQGEDRSWVPKYKTLSYVWGEPIFDDNIWIDSKRLAITKSLGSALRRLRPAAGKPPLCIWIDQICINQFDTMERNQQVRLMHAIYRYASQVLVWLGSDPDGHATRAFQLVQSMKSIFGDPLLAKLCKSQGSSFDWIPIEYWKSLRELTRLPWFHRVWIPQEIGTDAPATVHWGSASMEWVGLASMMRKLDTQGWELKKKHKIDTAAVTILYRRFADSPETAAAEQRSFVYQLCVSARKMATEPRDYVFSQLGHPSAWIDTEKAIIIQPDYKNTVEDVYHEIAIRALTTDNTLMVLNAVLDNPDVSKSGSSPSPKGRAQSTLPTWVPRWNAPRLQNVIGYPGRYKACSARGLDRRSGIISASFLNGYKTLVVRGLIIDTIDRTSPKFAPNCFTPDSSKKSQIVAAWGLSQPDSKTRNSSKSIIPVKFTTQGTYQPDPSRSMLEAFLDTLAPAARFSDTLATSSPHSGNRDRQIYHAGISALANIFTTSSILSRPSSSSTSSSNSAFSSKHDPRKLPTTPNLNLPSGQDQNSKAENFTLSWTNWIQAADDHTPGRRFGVTKESGYFALLPPGAKPGDLLCLLRGGETPYILREQQHEGPRNTERGAKSDNEVKSYMFVGETYVPGLMNESSNSGSANGTDSDVASVRGEIMTFRIE